MVPVFAGEDKRQQQAHIEAVLRRMAKHATRQVRIARVAAPAHGDPHLEWNEPAMRQLAVSGGREAKAGRPGGCDPMDVLMRAL